MNDDEEYTVEMVLERLDKIIEMIDSDRLISRPALSGDLNLVRTQLYYLIS